VTERPTLTRRLDLGDALAVGLGAIVGGGIFAALAWPPIWRGRPCLCPRYRGSRCHDQRPRLGSAGFGFSRSRGRLRFRWQAHSPGCGVLCAAGCSWRPRPLGGGHCGHLAAYVFPQAAPNAARAVAVGAVSRADRAEPHRRPRLAAGQRRAGSLKLGALGCFSASPFPNVNLLNLKPLPPTASQAYGGRRRCCSSPIRATRASPPSPRRSRILSARYQEAAVISVLLSLALYAAVALAAVWSGGHGVLGAAFYRRGNEAPLLVAAAFSGYPPAARCAVLSERRRPRFPSCSP
jgi:hypothetical protein